MELLLKGMEKISVLIADDEAATREGLKTMIPWNELGIDTVLLASDGKEALAAVEEAHPEIIITDIRMPHINGITFAREVKRIMSSAGKECAVIFISGYSDKEFMKSAIELRAVRYVEKPIHPKEIVHAIKDAVRHIKKERELYAFSDKKYLMGRYALEALDKNTDFSELSERITRIIGKGFDASESFMAVAAIGDIGVSTLESAFDSTGLTAIYAEPDEDTHVVLLGFKKVPGNIRLHTLLETASKKLDAVSNRVFLVAGNTVRRFCDLPHSFSTAIEMKDLWFFRGWGGYIFAERTRRSAREQFGEEKLYYDALEKMDSAKAFEALKPLNENISLRCAGGEYPDTGSVTDALRNMAVAAEAAAERAGISLEACAGGSKGVAAAESFSAAYDLLWAITEELFRQYSRAAMSRPVLTILRYIDTHYMDKDFGITDISKSVHLTTSHVCHIFKKEAGMTINNYLTATRLKQAAILLTSGTERPSTVAQRVGYTDPDYFARLFKRFFGVTPSEFRRNEQP